MPHLSADRDAIPDVGLHQAWVPLCGPPGSCVADPLCYVGATSLHPSQGKLPGSMRAPWSSLPSAFNSKGPALGKSHPSLSHWPMWSETGLAFLAPIVLIIRVTFLQEALLIEIMLHFLRLGHSIQNMKAFKYF